MKIKDLSEICSATSKLKTLSKSGKDPVDLSVLLHREWTRGHTNGFKSGLQEGLNHIQKITCIKCNTVLHDISNPLPSRMTNANIIIEDTERK